MAARVKNSGEADSRIWDVSLGDVLGRGQAAIEFRWNSPQQNVSCVRVTLATVVGSVQHTVRAQALGIVGRAGKATIPIDVSRIPAGAARVTLAPVDEGNHAGGSADLEFDVPGVNTTRRDTVELQFASRQFARPERGGLVFLAGRVRCDRGTTALLVHLKGPNPIEATIDLAPPSEDATVVLFAFAHDHPIGRYEVTVYAVDTLGALGASKTVAIELALRRGSRAPDISSLKALKDNRVLLKGTGFLNEDAVVTLNGRRAAILQAAEKTLLIEPPDIDEPAPISVRTSAGIATTRTIYIPSVRVKIVSSPRALEQGTSRQFFASVTGTRDARVRWVLRAGSGCTLSRSGRLAVGGRARGTITIVARSVADRRVVDSLRLSIVARKAISDSVFGTLGGSLTSNEGSAVLHVPRGAFTQATRIQLKQLQTRVPMRGARVPLERISVIGPAGDLKRPAKLEISLRTGLDRSSSLSVETLVRGRWRPVAFKRGVRAADHVITISIQQLPLNVRVSIPIGIAHLPQNVSRPMITSLAPAALDEGATAAILLSGFNFVPGLTTVVVLNEAGKIESRVEIRSIAITADGTRLGFGLKVGVMTEFGEASVRSLPVRVETPAGSATYALKIVCHDELSVPAGSTQSIAESATFSMISVPLGAGLTFANSVPGITLTCISTAELASTIEMGGGVTGAVGSGGRPAPGDLAQGAGAGGAAGKGAGLASIGEGGAGGQGGTGADGVGASGAAGTPSLTLNHVGSGGNGGGGGGGGIFPHLGGDGGNGGAGMRDGRLLSLAFEPGPGGGGGGGGGGEGWIFHSIGGGGGGGGAGGAAFEIAAGEYLNLDGDVLAVGGDGRFGAFPFTAIAPVNPPLIAAGRGGGGGGGAGGMIKLHGVVAGAQATVLAVGGADGGVPPYGPLNADARTLRQILLARPSSGELQIDGQLPATTAPVFIGPDIAYIPNLLAVNPQTTVDVTAADSVTVLSEQGLEANFDNPNLSQTGAVPIDLYEGFNTVSARLSYFFGASNVPLRDRRILYLPGTVALYQFSCDIEPAAPTVPTERTVKLTATVVAVPMSPLAWSVLGGQSQGRIIPNGLSATFQAPTLPPLGAVAVHASSTLAPAFFGIAMIGVIAGIEIASQATSGTPSDPSVPSANVGQSIAVQIPQPVFAGTGQGFAVNQGVTFGTVGAGGGCTQGSTQVTASVDLGMESLTVTVPTCTLPDHLVRVPGHGSARLLIVPVITSVLADANNFPNTYINGSGFVCASGQTQVITQNGALISAQILQVTCGSIYISIRPSIGEELQIRTAGGTSDVFTVT
jgi:hypothetical protein